MTQWNSSLYTSITPANTFADKYGIVTNNMYTLLNSGHKFIVKYGKQVYVEEGKLLLRRDFYKRIWLKCHENFEFIVYDEGVSENKLGKFLERYTGRSQAGWVNYVNRDLFSLAHMDKSIISYKVPSRLWEFYRITTFMIRKFKRLEQKRVEDIYKRLPNRECYEKITLQRGVNR